MQRLRLYILPAILSTTLTGCGGPDVKPVPLVRVTGTVTLDQKPLENAVVVFESPDGSFSYAETDADGSYDLQFDSQTRGVTHGTKTVRISMNRRILGLNSNDEGRPDDRAGGSFPKQKPEPIPPRYNEESDLTVVIDADSDEFNFDLTGNR